MNDLHEAVLNRWRDGETSADIRAALNLRRASVVRTIVIRARKRGDVRAINREFKNPGGPRMLLLQGEFPHKSEIARCWHAAAQERGCTVQELAANVLRAVADHGLFNAVLGDE